MRERDGAREYLNLKLWLRAVLVVVCACVCLCSCVCEREIMRPFECYEGIFKSMCVCICVRV